MHDKLKYTPPFHIENGSIYEYSLEQRAYIHIYKKSALSKTEYQSYQKAIAVYEKLYDKLRDSI